MSVCDRDPKVAAAALSAMDVPGFLDADSRDANGLILGATATDLGLFVAVAVGIVSLAGLAVVFASFAAAFSLLRRSSICRLSGLEDGRTAGFLTCCDGSLPSRDRFTPATEPEGCPFAPGPVKVDIEVVEAFFFLNVACLAFSRIFRAAPLEAVEDFLLILARTLLHLTFSSCSSSTVSSWVPSCTPSVQV